MKATRDRSREVQTQKLILTKRGARQEREGLEERVSESLASNILHHVFSACLSSLISCCPPCDILYATTLNTQQTLCWSPFLPVLFLFSVPRQPFLLSPNNVSHLPRFSFRVTSSRQPSLLPQTLGWVKYHTYML